MAKHVITKDNSLYALLYGTFGAALSLGAASMTAQKVATRATKPPAYLPGNIDLYGPDWEGEAEWSWTKAEPRPRACSGNRTMPDLKARRR